MKRLKKTAINTILMKRKIFFIFFTLTLTFPVVLSQEINARNIGYLDGEISFSSSLSSSIKLDKLNYSVHLLPENYDDLKVSTDYYFKEDEYGNKFLILHWDDFVSSDYIISASIKNHAKFSSVKSISFPYSPPQEVWIYLEETEKNKITDEIREASRKITFGSKDSFEAISRISHWIYQNVEYNLNYGNVIQDSEWVYKNKIGTCDEFSNLLIAMSRSIGIPARYIAGAIYSKEGWGYHAWTEVYLDEWVPVDPTWDEIGWLDATHIPVGRFKDANEVMIKFDYVGRGKVDITAFTPKVSLDIVQTNEMPKIFSIESESYPEIIGPGDSAIVEMEIKNNGNGCVATDIIIIPRVDRRKKPVIEVTDKHLLSVCPGKSIKTHFVVEAEKDLERGYTYSDLGDIFTFLGEKVSIDLKIDTDEKRRSKIDLILDEYTVPEGERIKFNVITDTDYKVYSDLLIIDDEILADEVGDHYIIAVTDTGEVIKQEIKVKETVNFRIRNIKKPLEIECGETFNITFDIENLAEPLKMEISTFVSDELNHPGNYTFDFDKGERKEIILISKLREECSREDQFISISVNDQRIYEKITVKTKRGASEIIYSIIEFIRSLLSKLF